MPKGGDLVCPYDNSFSDLLSIYYIIYNFLNKNRGC